jgi:EpsD family peptidyl-prolyl cis-trans isomerase
MFIRLCKPLLLVMLIGTTACGEKTPEGSIVAVVNGEEVTLAELNHEASARNIGNVSEPAVKRALVEEIVNRKLLVQQAIDAKLDRSQNYLLSTKRANELLLAELMVKSLSNSRETPDDAAVEAFIRRTGGTPGKQTTFIVDQIVFPRPADPNVLRRIEATKTLQEVQQVLASASVPMRRMTMPWDSSAMPADLIGSLKRLPAGAVFVIAAGNPLVAGTVQSQSQTDVSEEQQRARAIQALQQEKAQRLLKTWLESSRRSAKMSFQTGYGPAPAKGEEKIPPPK